MLTEDEDRHQHDEVIALIAALELSLLGIIVHHVMSDDPSAATDATIAIGSAIGRARGGLRASISRDYEGAYILNVIRDCEASGASHEATRWAITEAGRIARDATRDASQSLDQMLNGMRESARQGYYQALNHARRMSNVWGHEIAMESAVTELARNGITAYTYVRKDGVIVHVPVDVAVRRELNRAGKDRQTAQTLDIAKRNGMNYVDVSICPDARISHAQWQGKRYQLNGAGEYPNFNTTCHVGDPVDGYGGYNCHHTIAIARPGEKYRFQKDKDRMEALEKAGYDNKRIRDLTGQQRALENAIRKEKRVAATLKAAGLPTKDSNRLIRGYQAQLRELIGQNPQALKRAPWRESVYDKAMKEVNQLPVSLDVADIIIPRSLSAAAWRDPVKLADGSTTKLTPGTRITGLKVIAGKGTKVPIKNIDKIVNKFGGKRSEWKKLRGRGFVDDLGLSRECELHWYEEDSVGRVYMKVKKYYN